MYDPDNHTDCKIGRLADFLKCFGEEKELFSKIKASNYTDSKLIATAFYCAVNDNSRVALISDDLDVLRLSSVLGQAYRIFLERNDLSFDDGRRWNFKVFSSLMHKDCLRDDLFANFFRKVDVNDNGYNIKKRLHNRKFLRLLRGTEFSDGKITDVLGPIFDFSKTETGEDFAFADEGIFY